MLETRFFLLPTTCRAHSLVVRLVLPWPITLNLPFPGLENAASQLHRRRLHKIGPPAAAMAVQDGTIWQLMAIVFFKDWYPRCFRQGSHRTIANVHNLYTNHCLLRRIQISTTLHGVFAKTRTIRHGRSASHPTQVPNCSLNGKLHPINLEMAWAARRAVQTGGT